MGSRKPSAKAKQAAAFRDQLYSYSEGLDGAFSREAANKGKKTQAREAAQRKKACESKNRYASRYEAEATIQDCADHGTTGLECYKCPYCNGWHLTSHPFK